MTTITPEQAQKLLDGATRGPWQADGDPWNRIVWSSAENRVCFMAHTNGLDDSRDIATSDLVAAAPDLARQFLATMEALKTVLDREAETHRRHDEKLEQLENALAEAQAAQALVIERAASTLDDCAGDRLIDADHADAAGHDTSADMDRFAAEALREASGRIRSLADPTGVKLLAELRGERDRAREGGSRNWERSEGYRIRAEAAEQLAAERLENIVVDEAQLAEAQTREAGLREAATLALSDLEVAFKAGTSMIELIRLGTGAGIRLRAALSAAPTGEEGNG